jgi:hypothetical protein
MELHTIGIGLAKTVMLPPQPARNTRLTIPKITSTLLFRLHRPPT